MGNISKDFTANNMKRAELNWYVYKFSVGYNITDTSNIIDIHKYLMKNMIQNNALNYQENVYCVIK